MIIDKLIKKGEIASGRATCADSERKSATQIAIDTGQTESLQEGFLALSGKARTEGLLSIEDDLYQIDDLFLRRGLQFVVDGTDPEIINSILHNELESYKQERALKIKEETLRMERDLADTIKKKKMMIAGVLSVQAGDNLRILAEKLESFQSKF